MSRFTLLLESACLQHSDLKPENIMFRASTGEAVLCDLGAGRVTRNTGASMYDGHAGSMPYLAPELITKEDRSATRESDM